MEEASTSDTVGFIRSGEMLAEHNPQVLMTTLSCATLEDVFYQICMEKSQQRLDGEQRKKFIKYSKVSPDSSLMNGNSIMNGNRLSQESTVYCYEMNQKGFDDKRCHVRLNSSPDIEIFSRLNCAKKRFLCSEHIFALLYREYLSYGSKKLMYLSLLLLSIFTIWLFEASYGRMVKNVGCAMVNYDEGVELNNETLLISDRYHRHLSKICDFSYFDSIEKAEETVHSGRNTLAIALSKNFSRSFMIRYDQLDRNKSNNFEDFEDEEYQQIVDESTIKTYRDHSRVLVARFMNLTLMNALHDTILDLSHKFKLDPSVLSTPLKFEEFIYGSMEMNVQPTFLSGILLITQFAMICVVASLKIVLLKENGCLERDLNQSVSPIELNISFHIIPLFLIAIETICVNAFTFYFLKVPLQGSFIEVCIVVFVTNIQALFLGTLISSLIDNVSGTMVCFIINCLYMN